ncbi:MAG TPA: chloride channel protein [Vicinamibacterales bacterium]|nr:chloride channel protein [Vicinamibacterales bacterium]
MSDISLSDTRRLRLRENQLFLALSIIIGILAGLAAVLFTLAIDRADDALFGLAPSWLRILLVPVVVSIGTGILLATVFPGVRGSGVPQTKAAFHLQGGVIPGRVPLGKFVTGVLCIGSGHSMGREGPSVQIGAGIASVIGQWLRLSPARVKELVPVGAAGALAAAFNTPIAAVLFALEEIIGDLNATLIGSTVVASVASVVVQRSILGNEPLFHVPAYQLVHPAELIGYAALGVVGGAVSLIFCKSLLALRQAFLDMPRSTVIWQPAIGGVAIGAGLLFVPEMKGVGYEYVDQALNGGLVFRTLVLLCFVKLAATIISYCSGNAGGIFAPSLYIGAMAGGAIGTLVNLVAPFPTGEPGAYALVGMGTLFAGIIRAPMTSVFMIFEITQDYQILVPLMVANLLSFVISRRYQPIPVYDALLRQDRIHLPGAGTRASLGWTARDVMNVEAPFLAADTLVHEARGAAQVNRRAAYLVGTPERLLGLVTPERLEEALEAGRGGEAVATLAEETFAHVHPDHAIDIVLERLADSTGLLPVVSRAAGRVDGVITFDDIARFTRRRQASGASERPENEARTGQRTSFGDARDQTAQANR